MLSTSEIIELEKKVLRYRIKQRMHYVIYFILVLLSASSAVYFYYTPFMNPNTAKEITPTIENNLSIVLQAIDNNLSQKVPTNISNLHVEEKSHFIEPKVLQEEETSEKKDETLMLHLPLLKKTTQDKKTPQMQSPKEEAEKKRIPKEEEMENRLLIRKKPSSAEETFYRSMEETIESNSMLAPPPLGEEKQKGIIKIETQEVNSIQYLKDKFEKTHNIIFALMLSEEYFLTKNYQQSNKWALIANSIDSENEKSWIWFAKSKVKLGQKEDAVVALKAYLKNHKSAAIQSLLNQINLGEVND